MGADSVSRDTTTRQFLAKSQSFKHRIHRTKRTAKIQFNTLRLLALRCLVRTASYKCRAKLPFVTGSYLLQRSTIMMSQPLYIKTANDSYSRWNCPSLCNGNRTRCGKERAPQSPKILTRNFASLYHVILHAPGSCAPCPHSSSFI
jgi:hypothetical protein